MSSDDVISENMDSPSSLTSKHQSATLLQVSTSKMTKKESLKLQKQTYKIEKKKAGDDFKMISRNSSVVVLSDWLKVRSTLKNWTRMWCVVNPGMLIFYKNSKQKQWIGTAMLASVEIIERPSKKQGMCFKIYHLMDQCIWAPKGPKGETTSFLTNSLPSTHVILRAQTESDGQCWIDALELAKNCSKLIKGSLSVDKKRHSIKETSSASSIHTEKNEGLEIHPVEYFSSNSPPSNTSLLDENGQNSRRTIRCSSDSTTHFTPVLAEEYNARKRTYSSVTCEDFQSSSSDSGLSENEFDQNKSVLPVCSTSTVYVANFLETLGDGGENAQVEELAGENKNLLWLLLKQIRPGMDLSKVVLPTFILEPRSFLDKLSDYYYHADLLTKATTEANAYDRIKAVTRWYLSGFYKKPEGLKKPYNPILGETFRCKWEHPSDGSQSFYIAEQVSHHPPISAFVVINRKAGFTVRGTILAKSKYYGNSVSAILEGMPTLSLLNLGEDYCVTLPYAHCKGILYGKMSMELGGKVKIKCEKTGYAAELDFKLKKLFAGTGKVNEVYGRISLGQRVLATLSGCWDEEVLMTDLNNGTVEEFWCPNEEVKKARLLRYTVDLSEQGEFESENLWKHVTAAIVKKDQVAATEEKTKLETKQRESAKFREENCQAWVPKYFEYNIETNEYDYKYMDARPWDMLNDIEQFESCGIIGTKAINKTFPVRNVVSSALVLGKDKTNHSDTSSQKTAVVKADLSQIEHTNFNLELQAKISDSVTVAMQPMIQKQEAVLIKLISLQKELVTMHKEQGKLLHVIKMFLLVLPVILGILIYFI